MSADPVDGIVSRPRPFGVTETVNRLTEARTVWAVYLDRALLKEDA